MKRMLLGVGMVLAASFAAAGEEKVALNQVPAPVIAAVKKRFPGAELRSAEREKEDGKTIYEIALKAGGKNVEVEVTPEGVLLVIDTEITLTDAPKAVAAAVTAKYPKGKVTKVGEVVTLKDGTETFVGYEVAVDVDGKEVELRFGKDGMPKSDDSK